MSRLHRSQHLQQSVFQRLRGLMRGASPFNTTTASVRPERRCLADRTACAVPNCSCCSTILTDSPLRLSFYFFFLSPTTTIICEISAFCTASITHSKRVIPHTSWSTLGLADRIRVPFPAARITAVAFPIIHDIQ